jgi:hypothetical protein
LSSESGFSVARFLGQIGELLESLGHNPIEAMVRIATDPKASLELRGRMNAELAHYVYPKRKAVEVVGDREAPLVIHKVILEAVPAPEVPPEEADGRQHRNLLKAPRTP